MRAEYKIELSERLEVKDTCVSSIYESVQRVPEALEIVEQYIRGKEILLNKEVLTSEFIERLIVRFRGEVRQIRRFKQKFFFN